MSDGAAQSAVQEPAVPGVSLVLSFRNEEACLPELIARLRKVLGDERKAGRIRGHELIFVNDASTDASETVLRAHAVGNDDIRIINMSRNFGVSPCVLAGMERSSGDLVIYMDADLQDPPELIPELVRAWKSEPGVGVVHTVRTNRAGESRLKLAITHLGYRILHLSSSIKLPMQAGDFKLVSREVVDHLVAMKEKRPFLRGLVCWIGFKQKTVNYAREARAGERHQISGDQLQGNQQFSRLGTDIVFGRAVALGNAGRPAGLRAGVVVHCLGADRKISRAQPSRLVGGDDGRVVPGRHATALHRTAGTVYQLNFSGKQAQAQLHCERHVRLQAPS